MNIKFTQQINNLKTDQGAIWRKEKKKKNIQKFILYNQILPYINIDAFNKNIHACICINIQIIVINWLFGNLAKNKYDPL